MSKIYDYITFIYIIYFFLLYEINSKVVEIKSENINNLEDVIIQNSQNDENLVLTFNENYYNMSNFPFEGINISITSNITFSGLTDGTVFDFKNFNNGFMKIMFKRNKGDTIKFENIIFKNFYPDIDIVYAFMFSYNFESDGNYIKYENCVFIDNNYTLFNIKMSYTKTINSDYFISFDHCNF